MRIKEFTFEMGSDFHAMMECEHCGGTQELKSGYHDHNYHLRVIPEMECKSCGKSRNDLRVAAA